MDLIINNIESNLLITCHFIYYLYSQTFFLFLSTTPNLQSHDLYYQDLQSDKILISNKLRYRNGNSRIVNPENT